VFAAQHQFHRTRQATVQACAAFDYVLSPVAPITAFDAQLASPTNDPLRPLEHIAFTVPFNMSEQPAASVLRAVGPGPAHRAADRRPAL
jgi:Asp-tRNA(Asn)/Glu-tRNA(Gln) amidotransferase A subunit family amidase